MAKPNWGLKRTCLSCGERFYDMKRDPIVCPTCEAVLDPLALVRPRRARAAAAASQAKAKAKAKAASEAQELSNQAALIGDDELEVDADNLDLGNDDEDLIADNDGLEVDAEISEALENVKEDK
ncbi:MAG: TIGR02300 family protein [Pseudomonadota bacterium]|nr:TIGR02300 family protein [Pseudomonadota bacterium]